MSILIIGEDEKNVWFFGWLRACSGKNQEICDEKPHHHMSQSEFNSRESDRHDIGSRGSKMTTELHFAAETSDREGNLEHFQSLVRKLSWAVNQQCGVTSYQISVF